MNTHATSLFRRTRRLPALGALALTALATLAGCGGGSSASAPSTSPSVVPVALTPGTSAYVPVVQNVPPPNFTSTEDTTASVETNVLRKGTGTGLLAQHPALDTAAKNHAGFIVDNHLAADGAYLDALHEGILGGHYEDPARPGFTGKSPQERTSAAGYAGTVSEIITFGAASAQACIGSLENSVYHLSQLLSPWIDLGVAFNPGSDGGSACVIELGVSGTLGQLPNESATVYPYDGQDMVTPVFYNHAETPAPAPDLAQAGHPLAVSLYSQAAPDLVKGDIVLHGFTLTTNSGTPVSGRVLVRAGVSSDGPPLTVDNVIPNIGHIFLLPTTPLAPNTQYRATFSATVKGIAVSKSWSFTTGNAASDAI